jgi:hypothetical protein
MTDGTVPLHLRQTVLYHYTYDKVTIITLKTDDNWSTDDTQWLYQYTYNVATTVQLTTNNNWTMNDRLVDGGRSHGATTLSHLGL